MNYLLDTCTVSELVKRRPEPAVVEWLRKEDDHRLYLSVLTLGELEKGIAKLEDEIRRSTLQQWVEHDLQQRFQGRILDVTLDVAQLWGQVQGKAERQGRKMPVMDGLIAATALHFGCTLVTRNVKDVEPSGVQVFDPWP